LANIPHYAAAALGCFRAEGLDVTLVTAPKDTIPPEGYRTADVILGPPEKAWEAGCPIFAQLTRYQPGFLVAREPKDGFSWNDLRHRGTIGPGPDTGLQTALETILRREKLRPQLDAVIIQNLPPYLQLGAYMAGSGSFILSNEPRATALELAGAGRVVASLTAAGELPGQVCAANPRAAEKKADVLVAYTRALVRAHGWLARHSPREIAALVGPFFPQFNYETLVRMIERGKQCDLWPETPLPDRSQFDALQRILVESGELRKPIPFERLVQPRIAAEAVRPQTKS
ncbi:MAG: hypothetical protein QMC81_03005, partial [Thermoanaerobacterales bacterium]|nr:hypothetical protein [Thermoanaerobacterales bacterium]